MKRLTRYLLPILLSIMPTCGMDQDDYKSLNQPNTIYSVTNVRPVNNTLLAYIAMTPEKGEPRTLKVKAFFNAKDIIDQIDERGAFGQKVGELCCDADGSIISATYTMPEIFRYTEISSPKTTYYLNDVALGEPYSNLKMFPFGEVVKVCEEAQYERPDKSIFKAKREAQVIAKGIYADEQLSKISQFLALPLGTVVNIHKAAVTSGDDVAVTESDPLIYQIVVQEYIHQFTGWECARCYKGGFKNKQYHEAVGYDYKGTYKRLMIRISGKEDTLYPKGQSEGILVKMANGKRDNESSNHDPQKPEYKLATL